MDIEVLAGVPDRLVQVIPSLGIVRSHRTYEDQLNIRDLLLHDAIGIDDPQGVLPRVEAADLRDDGTADVNPKALDDLTPAIDGNWCVLR